MSEVLYIEQLAKMLGKTESAIRASLSRSGDLPPAIRIGRKYAWRRADVEAWLEAKVQKGGAA